MPTYTSGSSFANSELYQRELEKAEKLAIAVIILAIITIVLVFLP